MKCRLPPYGISTVYVALLRGSSSPAARPPPPPPCRCKACVQAPGAEPQGLSSTRRAPLRRLHGFGHAAGRSCPGRCAPLLRLGTGPAPVKPHAHASRPARITGRDAAWAQRGFAAQVASKGGGATPVVAGGRNLSGRPACPAPHHSVGVACGERCPVAHQLLVLRSSEVRSRRLRPESGRNKAHACRHLAPDQRAGFFALRC